MNYYEVLEVTTTASAEVIKNAYKTLAKKYHPDAYKGDTAFAEEKMKLINEAAAILTDDEKRRRYDIENGINLRREGSTVFTSADESFLDNIDDFIKTKKNAAPAKRIQPDPAAFDAVNNGGIGDIFPKNKKKKSSLFSLSLTDIANADDFAPVPLDDGISSGDSDDSEFESGGVEDLVDGTGEFTRIYKKSRGVKKSKPKIGKWYYFTVAALAILNIALIFMIIRSINIENIRALIGSLKGGGDGGVHDDELAGITEPYHDPDDIIGVPNPDDQQEPETEPQPQPSNEPHLDAPVSTYNPTEPQTEALTAPPPTTARATAPPATSPPATNPPPTSPPETTAEPTTEPTTEPETVPETEPQTEEPTQGPEPPPEPTFPDHDDPTIAFADPVEE